MSLIDPRHECDRCGGYRMGHRSSLSSACKCPDYDPPPLPRHSIGGPRSKPGRGLV
jgi:hypothetical protein